MRPYLMFPLITHRLITIHMTSLVLPFAIAQTVTSAYLTTLKEVMR